MNHEGCFLTGFLTGQRLKRWQLGMASGAASGPGFYDWAAASGAPDELLDPAAYAQFVAGLPSNIQLNSDDTLTWSPTIDDAAAQYPLQVLTGVWTTSTGGTNYFSAAQLNAANNWTLAGNFAYTPNGDRRSWTLLIRASGGFWGSGVSCFRYTAPIDGTYYLNGSTALSGSASYRNGTVTNSRVSYPAQSDPNSGAVQYRGGVYGIGNTGEYSANSVTSRPSFSFTGGSTCVLCELTMYLPVFIIRPYSTAYQFSAARPGQLPGSPINETARTFTNPLTGQIISFDSFTYDYVTRTYTLALPDDGGNITVTFGDDNLTITGIGGDAVTAMYPENTGVPIVSPDGDFDKTAFLSGLAAGMTSRGWT